MKPKNYGLIIEAQKPEDWIFGSALSAGGDVLQPDGQWDQYLPKEEEQTEHGFDPLSCASYGTLNAIEMLIKRLYGEERNYSDRFLATVTGTKELRGNSPQTIAEWLRKKGDVLEELCAFGADVETYDQYYAIKDIDKLVVRAAAFPAEFAFNHEYVPVNPTSMKDALHYSPLGVSVYAWPHRDDNGYYFKLPGEQDNHWCTIYGYEDGKYWKVFDSAENATKKVRWDTSFQIVKRYSLKRQVVQETWWQAFLKLLGLAANEPALPSKPAPEPPKPPTPIPPTTPADWPLIQALIQVESGGDDNAIGDLHLKQKAYGPLQIRQPVCDDINAATGSRYTATQMLGNRDLSINVFREYMKLWATPEKIGRPVTDEDRARCWNGGPTGWKRSSTLGYWAKVQKALTKQAPSS